MLDYCALDTMLDVPVERVRLNPEDVIGGTALAILATDLGDTQQGLEHARVAVALEEAPPEAQIWRAKAAWWLGEEARAALEILGATLAVRALSLRCGVEVLRRGSRDRLGAVAT